MTDGRWTSGRRAFVAAAAIFLLLTAVFFGPIVRYNATFSIIAGHQTAIPYFERRRGVDRRSTPRLRSGAVALQRCPRCHQEQRPTAAGEL